MSELKKHIIHLGIITILIGLLCIPLVSANSEAGESVSGEIGPGQDTPVTVEKLATDPVITGPAPQDDLSSGVISGGTQLTMPVLVSPTNGQQLFNYPRVTTLAWKPVPYATSYVVERQYCSGSTCWNYAPVTVYGNSATSYTFTFVGDQPGRWRVTAKDGTTHPKSVPSAWRTFSYPTTKPTLSTPILTSPSNYAIFYNYPRTTTLAWKPVPGATGYRLERQYCTQTLSTCWNYQTVTTTGPLNTYYTFNFVGAQPGKWRVTALGGTYYRDSTPSGWRIFTYKI
jgi:hypothetical protein